MLAHLSSVLEFLLGTTLKVKQGLKPVFNIKNLQSSLIIMLFAICLSVQKEQLS